MARYTRLDKTDIDQLAAPYGLTVAGFQHFDGGAANSSYLLFAGDAEKVVLTVFEETPVPEVIGMGKLLLLLAEHEFPTVRLLRPANGDIVTLYQEKPVMLKTYIEGQDCECPDETALGDIGTALARLHRMPVPDFVPGEHSYRRKTIPTVIGSRIDPPYESWLTEELDRVERSLPRGLPRGLIHGDLFFDNVLTDNNEFRAIIDFEGACRDYLAFDLAMAIAGLCVENAALRLDKVGALVSGYQQVRRLEANEKEALQTLVAFAAAVTSCWRFWKNHISAPGENRAKAHLEMVRLTEVCRGIPEEEFRDEVLGEN